MWINSGIGCRWKSWTVATSLTILSKNYFWIRPPQESDGYRRGDPVKLTDENQLENTRRKLSGLLALIEHKERDTVRHPAHRDSLKSMKRFADKLRAEIEEYEKRHQTV